MIYFATLIFTLLLSHIVYTMPTCGNVVFPQDMSRYDTYDDEQVLAPYKITWDSKYDNPMSKTLDFACSNGPNGLASVYPLLRDFHGFPNLAGTPGTTWGSYSCGKCWKLTSQSGKYVYVTGIDTASPAGGFTLSKQAFDALNGGPGAPGATLDADAIGVSPYSCRFK